MAKYTTIGVYIFANLEINNCVFDFRAVASCTISRIFDSLLSLKSVVTFISATEFRFIIPAKTTSSIFLESGLLSPVSAAVLKEALSEINNPSKATFSPART